MIDLLIHAVRCALKSANKTPAVPTTTSRLSDPIVLDCPVCHEIQVAPARLYSTRTAALLSSSFPLYQCPRCNSCFHASACTPDSAGVLHVTPWICPCCLLSNPNYAIRCQSCHLPRTKIP